jgi:hypothetical protein
MQSLQIELVLCLDRHETHVLAAHCLSDRFCIEEAVLVGLHKRLPDAREPLLPTQLPRLGVLVGSFFTLRSKCIRHAFQGSLHSETSSSFLNPALSRPVCEGLDKRSYGRWQKEEEGV